MATVQGTFDELKGHNNSLIRKMLEMAVFLDPWVSGTSALATITDSAGSELVLPDTLVSVGMTSKDAGGSVTPNIDVSEVGAYGYGAAVRRDVSARNETVQFTMLESKRVNFEVYYGIDLASCQAGPTKNELYFDLPDRPDTKYFRCLMLGRDGQGTSSIYHAEFFPKVTLTDADAVAWSEGDPLAYAVTLSVDTDTTAGTSHRSFWAGPGFTTAVITAMGFSRSA